MAQHISEFIKQYYPQYYSIETYPADKVARIHKIDQEWGIFSNFGHSRIVVDGVAFDTSERLYQVMKFTDKDIRAAVYTKKGNPKMTAKKYRESTRPDWGNIVVDAMKFCLMLKYEQCEEFRSELQRSTGLIIVEDQTTFPRKTADTWGTKLIGDQFVGPNLLGRLLMELRDNGRLEYSLPEDAMSFHDLKDVQ